MTEEDDDDYVEEDEEEFSDEETDGSRTAYKKNRWRAAAEIITADFNIAGGPTHSWGEPTDKKIGPCSSRSVSENSLIYVCLAIEKLWVLICCVCTELRTEGDLECNVECVLVSVIQIV